MQLLLLDSSTCSLARTTSRQVGILDDEGPRYGLDTAVALQPPGGLVAHSHPAGGSYSTAVLMRPAVSDKSQCLVSPLAGDPQGAAPQ